MTTQDGEKKFHVEQNLDLFDENYPRSLINIVTGPFAEKLRALPKELLLRAEHDWDIFWKGQIAKGQIAESTLLQLKRFRTAFWYEYERAQSNVDTFKISRVYSMVGSRQYWEKEFSDDEVRLAYILCPVVDYTTAMREVLMIGLDQMRKIISAPLFLKDGNLNQKSAEIVLKAIEKVHIFVHGMPVIRHEKKSLNMNVNQNVAPPKLEKTVEEMEAELAALKAKRQAQLNPSTLESADFVVSDVREVVPLKSGDS